MLTDRFENGDPSNDQSTDVIKTVWQKLALFTAAIYAPDQQTGLPPAAGRQCFVDKPPFEQIHGWVGGGTKGDFPHMPTTVITHRTGRILMPIWAVSRSTDTG